MSRQRQAYQDALFQSATQATSAVLKGVINVVGEVMRNRELARLKREAEERARLEHEAFVRYRKVSLTEYHSILHIVLAIVHFSVVSSPTWYWCCCGVLVVKFR